MSPGTRERVADIPGMVRSLAATNHAAAAVCAADRWRQAAELFAVAIQTGDRPGLTRAFAVMAEAEAASEALGDLRTATS